MGGLVMAREAPAQDAMQEKRPQLEIYKVKVEVDRVSRDEPDTDLVSGVTHLEVNSNGDLLMYQEANRTHIPSVGYTSGVWLTFEIVHNEEE